MSEIAFQWLENNPDLARDENGNYPDTQLNLLRVYSIPLIDFEHLWKDKNVQKAASVWIHTDQWKIGFELNYKEMELIAIRPATDVTENDLEKYLEAPLFPVYIRPFHLLILKMPLYGTPALLQQRLAQAKAGSVLRNLLVAVSKDSEKWELLQKAIHSFFGYQLDLPSVGAKILVRYRHSKQDQSYDLTSAASGFLQILMIYAVLLEKDAQVVLIDKPDAHLHPVIAGKAIS